MSAIALKQEVGRASLAAYMSLDELLGDMRRHGLPGVTMLSKDGWYCNIKMHTNAKGAEFRVGRPKRGDCREASARVIFACSPRIVPLPN